MDYRVFEDFLSKPRMERYFKVMSGDEKGSIELYYQQAELAGALFQFLATFEILLRNKINSFMVLNYDENWLINLSKPKSPLNKKNTIYTFSALIETRKKFNK
jgi:hypothetical protein